MIPLFIIPMLAGASLMVLGLYFQVIEMIVISHFYLASSMTILAFEYRKPATKTLPPLPRFPEENQKIPPTNFNPGEIV